MQRDVCCISEEEIGRLTHYQEELDHTQHRHFPISRALRDVESGKLDLFEHNGKQYVTKAKVYYLRTKLSDGVPVVQRVLSNRPKHIQRPSEIDLTKE